MGTSQSSAGAPSGVPMVPPWVPDVGNPEPPNGDMFPDSDVSLPQSPPPVPIAPASRFSPARTNLGKYSSSGSERHMKQALGQYVHRGYGGADGATRRMGSTAAAGGRLYGALGHLAGMPNSDFLGPLDRKILQGRSATEVLDAIVNAVSPGDGTQDTEATRDSIARALSALCKRVPNVDLLNLNDTQREIVIQDFLANDISARFLLDCEKTIKEKAPLAMALARIAEIKNYIRQTVAASFRELHRRGDKLGSRLAFATIKNVLSETFHVFEDYLL